MLSFVQGTEKENSLYGYAKCSVIGNVELLLAPCWLGLNMFGGHVVKPALLLIVWMPRLIFGLHGYSNDFVVIILLFSLLLLFHTSSIATLALLLFLGLFTATAILLYPLIRSSSGASNRIDPQAAELGRLKPQVIPCRTSHARLFPKKHAFSYSYLQVGIPVGWRGSIGSIIAADPNLQGVRRLSEGLCFTVEAADHLNRGSDHVGLKGKLDIYIQDQVGGCSLMRYRWHLHNKG